LSAGAETFSDPPPADRRGVAPNKKKEVWIKPLSVEVIGTPVRKRQEVKKNIFPTPVAGGSLTW
jgi:hypothetical protein